MEGVLLQKLPGYNGHDDVEPARLDALLHVVLLKLALTMYHPHDRRRWLRLRLLNKMWRSRDISSLFIYKHDDRQKVDVEDNIDNSILTSTEKQSIDSLLSAEMPSLHLHNNQSTTMKHTEYFGRDAIVRGRARATTVTVTQSPPTLTSRASFPPVQPRGRSRGKLLERLGWHISPVGELDNWFESFNETSNPASKQPIYDNDIVDRVNTFDDPLPRAESGLLSPDDYITDKESHVNASNVQDLGNEFYWILEDIIGEGAVGMVYRARLIPPHPLPPLTVATKYLHIPSANPLLNRRNFQELIAALSLSTHPNLVGYYGSHILEEDAFIFMEYCDGGTLADWVKRNGRVNDKIQLRIWIKMMVEGLVYLHSHGLVHRDIKPSNIMLKNGVVKIGDFSSAKLHDLCCHRIHDTRVVGTPSYMAPEIVIGNQISEVTGVHDIWSLGTVIYELLLGKPPFSEIDNVWSLYFILGQYATLNIPPPTPRSSRVKEFLVKAQAKAQPMIDNIRYPRKQNTSLRRKKSIVSTVAAFLSSTPPQSPSMTSEEIVTSSNTYISTNDTTGELFSDEDEAERERENEHTIDLIVEQSSKTRDHQACVSFEDAFSFSSTLSGGKYHGKQYFTYARRQSQSDVSLGASPVMTSVDSINEDDDGDQVNDITKTNSTSPLTTDDLCSSNTSIPVDSMTSDNEKSCETTTSNHTIASSTKVNSSRSHQCLVTGTDMNGHPIYNFIEPVFPIIPNYHPLLNQLYQVDFVDPLALDFLKKCLTWDPQKRATAKALLQHPLIKNMSI